MPHDIFRTEPTGLPYLDSRKYNIEDLRRNFADIFLVEAGKAISWEMLQGMLLLTVAVADSCV